MLFKSQCLPDELRKLPCPAAMQVIGELAEVPLADPAAWLSDAAKRRRFDLTR